MEVNRVSMDRGAQYSVGSVDAAAAAVTQPAAVQNTEVRTGTNGKQQEQGQYPKLDRGDLESMSQALNQFMTMMNADLHFTVHEKTNTLMVRLVDETQNRVLREFPSHELLDTMVRIREYVGSLLDKKA